MPIDSLELRLERIKGLGNLRFDYLKRLYQGESIIKGYAEHRLDVHVHYLYRGIGVCGTYRAVDAVIVGDHEELVVPVCVGQPSQVLGPLTSTIRLQLLQRCEMRSAQSNKESLACGLTFETLWRLFDRKLCASFSGSRIQLGKPSNEVVESDPQIMGDVPDENLAARRDGGLSGFDLHDSRKLARAYSDITLTLYECGFVLSGANLGTQELKFIEVLPSPIPPEIGVI